MAGKSGYVAEHRKVAWEAGILTERSHQVHHKNGVKDDNRPENLRAMSLSDHLRIHKGWPERWAFLGLQVDA